ncbi:MAG TPA: NAD(P)H-binding protein, partial [Thermomonospora sp.]|nr:NAD(P)H-binding protein [Thermomonospora sp.]
VTAADVPAGVRALPADLADAESLRPCLAGADAVFLCPAGDLLVSAGDPRALVGVIREAGVRRVVLLSSQASVTRPQAVSHARLREFENVLRESGLAWTILRPGGFASNTFAYVPAVRAERTVVAPFGDVGLPLIDPADIAEVACAALRDARHAGHAYMLTGPSPVSPREQAAAIGEALGTDLGFTELTRDEALAAMTRFLPQAVAEGTLDILGAPTDEEVSVSPDVERVLGRTPRSYAEWARHNAATFR